MSEPGVTGSDHQENLSGDKNPEKEKASGVCGGGDETSGEEHLWQLMRPRLAQQNLYLMQRGTWADCTFLVQGAEFLCHKLLLAKSSPVFGSMLYGGLANADIEEPITIMDTEPEIFQTLLQFMYTGVLDPREVGEENAAALCLAADKYLLTDLKRRALDFLLASIKPDTAARVYELAKLINDLRVAGKAWNMMKQSTEEVVTSASFLDVQRSTVLELVQEADLNLSSEVLLISACERWAERKAMQQGLASGSEGLRKALGPVLQHLRFLSLSLKELTEGSVATTRLLTAEEKLILVRKIASPDIESSVLLTLCDITEARSCPIQKSSLSITFTKEENYQSSSGWLILPTVRCSQAIMLHGLRIEKSAVAQVDLKVSFFGVFDPSGQSLDVRGLAWHPDTAEVCFSRPIAMAAEQTYTLMFRSTTGVYKTGASHTPEQGKNVFLENSVAISQHNGLIRGVVYRLQLE